jgi:hypothetical protein
MEKSKSNSHLTVSLKIYQVVTGKIIGYISKLENNWRSMIAEFFHDVYRVVTGKKKACNLQAFNSFT